MPASAAGEPSSTRSTRAPARLTPSTSTVVSLRATPRKACSATPSAMSCWATSAAWSTGIAKPSPMLPDRPPERDAIELVMPMTSPRASNSGPPELPGLTAASTWIALVTTDSVRLWVTTGRSRAEMIPVVAVESRPSGLPMASTACPTARSAHLPIGAGARSAGGSRSRTTARSVVSSCPTTSASKRRPSASETLTERAPSTTWLLVSTWPSSSTTTPEPWPSPEAVTTSRATTDARTAAVTACQSGVADVELAGTTGAGEAAGGASAGAVAKAPVSAAVPTLDSRAALAAMLPTAAHRRRGPRSGWTPWSATGRSPVKACSPAKGTRLAGSGAGSAAWSPSSRASTSACSRRTRSFWAGRYGSPAGSWFVGWDIVPPRCVTPGNTDDLARHCTQPGSRLGGARAPVPVTIGLTRQPGEEDGVATDQASPGRAAQRRRHQPRRQRRPRRRGAEGAARGRPGVDGDHAHPGRGLRPRPGLPRLRGRGLGGRSGRRRELRAGGQPGRVEQLQRRRRHPRAGGGPAGHLPRAPRLRVQLVRHLRHLLDRRGDPGRPLRHRRRRTRPPRRAAHHDRHPAGAAAARHGDRRRARGRPVPARRRRARRAALPARGRRPAQRRRQGRGLGAAGARAAAAPVRAPGLGPRVLRARPEGPDGRDPGALGGERTLGAGGGRRRRGGHDARRLQPRGHRERLRRRGAHHHLSRRPFAGAVDASVPCCFPTWGEADGFTPLEALALGDDGVLRVAGGGLAGLEDPHAGAEGAGGQRGAAEHGGPPPPAGEQGAQPARRGQRLGGTHVAAGLARVERFGRHAHRALHHLLGDQLDDGSRRGQAARRPGLVHRCGDHRQAARSEERRVGKEGDARQAQEQ